VVNFVCIYSGVQSKSKLLTHWNLMGYTTGPPPELSPSSTLLHFDLFTFYECVSHKLRNLKWPSLGVSVQHTMNSLYVYFPAWQHCRRSCVYTTADWSCLRLEECFSNCPVSHKCVMTSDGNEKIILMV
jgi:hypothetical protein